MMMGYNLKKLRTFMVATLYSKSAFQICCVDLPGGGPGAGRGEDVGGGQDQDNGGAGAAEGEDQEAHGRQEEHGERRHGLGRR